MIQPFAMFMVVIRVMDKKRREDAAAARLALMDLPCDSSWASLVPAAVLHLVEDAQQTLDNWIWENLVKLCRFCSLVLIRVSDYHSQVENIVLGR